MFHQLLVAATIFAGLFVIVGGKKMTFDFGNSLNLNQGGNSLESEESGAEVDFFFPEMKSEADEASNEREIPSVSRVKRGIPDHLREMFKKAYRTPGMLYQTTSTKIIFVDFFHPIL